MKCISDELIQKYIDGEITPDERFFIDAHLAHCRECNRKVKEHSEWIHHFKQKINAPDNSKIDIPDFSIPAAAVPPMRKTRIKKLIPAISAACILLLISILSIPKDAPQPQQIVLLHIYENEFDANRTVSQQEMKWVLIDPEGNVFEY